MKEDLRVKKTHKLLCNALFELLEEKPFDEIKLNEICDRSMVHKTTFYNHFEDKYDLLRYSILQLQKELTIDLNNNKEEDLIEYYCNVAKIYMAHMKKNKKLYKSLIINNDNSLGIDIFFNSFKKDIENKLNNKYIPMPIDYISNYYVSGVFSLILAWFKKGMIESEDEMVTYLKVLIGNR